MKLSDLDFELVEIEAVVNGSEVGSRVTGKVYALKPIAPKLNCEVCAVPAVFGDGKWARCVAHYPVAPTSVKQPVAKEPNAEKELFEMVYQWGKVGVVTDYNAPAFKAAIQALGRQDMSNGFDEKKYTLDGEPVSATEIINAAIELDQEYDESGFHRTSVAADILRDNGHEVGTL